MIFFELRRPFLRVCIDRYLLNLWIVIESKQEIRISLFRIRTPARKCNIYKTTLN